MSLPQRLAIVGAGPRAAYALERLATLARRNGVSPPTTDVYGPGSLLGPGEVYDPTQPGWLRLNVASAAVHAWLADAQSPPRGPSFDRWRERRAPGSSADQFPARALAGRYLADVGAQVRDEVPGRRVTRRVTSLRRLCGQWLVDDQPYDAVLLALGHAEHWPGALHRRWPARAPDLVPRVFPVSALRSAVPDEPSGPVVVRGAALTAIDAALALTRDRRHPHRLILASRTGRLMLPKTEPQVLRSLVDLDVAIEPAAAALADPQAQVGDVLAAAARRIHAAACAGTAGTDTGQTVAMAICDLLSHNGPPDPRTWLREQLSVARGEAPVDGSWALGQAWRALTPALIARQESLRGRTRHPLGWAGYRRWAPELERLAFGPPPVNAQALLTLMDEAMVQVVPVTADVESLARLATDSRARAVVDAVLAPPGLSGISDPLLAQLGRQGWVSVSPQGRGLAVGPAAQCLSATGAPSPGLAAVGRVTEDVILGNDTLIRTMHPQLDRWARGILGLSDDSTLEEATHAHAG